MSFWKHCNSRMLKSTREANKRVFPQTIYVSCGGGFKIIVARHGD